MSVQPRGSSMFYLFYYVIPAIAVCCVAVTSHSIIIFYDDAKTWIVSEKDSFHFSPFLSVFLFRFVNYKRTDLFYASPSY